MKMSPDILRSLILNINGATLPSALRFRAPWCTSSKLHCLDQKSA